MEVGRIPDLVQGLRGVFGSGRTRSLAWRRRQLNQLRAFLEQRSRDIEQALVEDLGRPTAETQTVDVIHILSEIRYTLKRLAQWVRPEKVRTAAALLPGSCRIYKEPLGVVLIIGPWNYPLQLVLNPLVGALAAGNCAVIKPSEVAPSSSALLAARLPEYLDSDCVQVVEGGVPETTALLEQRFDHIFYTGSGTVGRIVMTAAARHLTPVTLELGGKSPCYVDREVNLEIAARRICWGKFFNAGQTCVAPDYLLVHKAKHGALLEQLRTTLVEFFGRDPRQSPDFGRIINAHHHRRLVRLLDSGEVVVGGEHDEADRYIAPTLLASVGEDAPVMGEEIFGPILPIIEVANLNAAVEYINRRDKPLALYVFTYRDGVAEQMLERTSSGGATVNHAWAHLAAPTLPFGGVGESGMGAYHGRASFDTFTHHKSVLKKPLVLDPAFAYPPYNETKLKWLRRLL